MGASGSRPTVGWRILKIMPNSPCSQKGLVAYFDVLTHVNGVELGTTEDQLVHLIKDGVETKLTIYHYVTDSVREVIVTPRRGWGGDGLLGLIIRYSHFDNADQDTIHVLEVTPNSPAAKAGLISHKDYMLGTSKLTFKGYDQLDYFLTQYNDQPGELFVFNADTYQVREVTITPSNKWGGKGSLGCDVGAGYLHRLPLETTRAVTQVGEGPMTATISTGTTTQQQPLPQQQQQQHGHSHAHGQDHGHSHGGHDDHGHAHGAADHGHSHGGHDDHGHAHGAHDDHGHAHGAHNGHGHAHGPHDDHGHAHAAGDHGHAHGAHDEQGHAHGDHGHAHHAPIPNASQFATNAPYAQQPQQPYQAQTQVQPLQQQQYHPQQQVPQTVAPSFPTQQAYPSYATPAFAGAPTSGLFTQELYGNAAPQAQAPGQVPFAGAPAAVYPPVNTGYPAAGAGAGVSLSVQAPFNTQYGAPQAQAQSQSQYPAHPAYLQQAPNQQPYIIQPAPVGTAPVRLEPSNQSLP